MGLKVTCLVIGRSVIIESKYYAPTPHHCYRVLYETHSIPVGLQILLWRQQVSSVSHSVQSGRIWMGDSEHKLEERLKAKVKCELVKYLFEMITHFNQVTLKNGARTYISVAKKS